LGRKDNEEAKLRLEEVEFAVKRVGVWSITRVGGDLISHIKIREGLQSTEPFRDLGHVDIEKSFEGTALGRKCAVYGET